MIASPSQAKFLYYMSWLGLPVGILGILNNKRGLGSCVCVGSFIAQNYWKSPKYDWWRILDILWIQFLIWSHAWHVFGTHVMIPYYSIQLLGVGFYVISWHQVKKKNMWKATLCHGMVHVCADVSLFLFYIS